MFLTMNIIQDSLKDFKIEAKLTSGSAPVKGISINEKRAEFVSVSEEDGAVVFTHGKDFLRVMDSPFDRTMNTVLEASRCYELWERDLYHMIFTGCSLQDITDKAFSLFQNPVFFVDETDHVLALTNHGKGEVNEAWDYLLDTGYLPFESSTASRSKIEGNIHSHQRGGRNVPFLFSPPTRDIDNRGINYRIYSPVTGEALGTMIIIENETPITLGMLNLSEILTNAVDEWLNMHKLDHPFKTDRNLIRELIEAPEEVHNKEVLKRYIRPCEEGYKLAVITGCGHIKEEQIKIMIEETLEGAKAYKYGEEIVVVFPLREPEEKIRRHLDNVLYYQGVRIGMSYPFFDLSALSNYYHQAKVALSYGSGKFAGLGPEIAMRYFTDETSKDLFGANIAHPALEILRDYDRKHGGELYETLYQFLRNERSLIASARALNIHRNSLIYRVEKIKQLVEIDLDDPDIREYILFSYRILKHS